LKKWKWFENVILNLMRNYPS